MPKGGTRSGAPALGIPQGWRLRQELRAWADDGPLDRQHRRGVTSPPLAQGLSRTGWFLHRSMPEGRRREGCHSWVDGGPLDRHHHGGVAVQGSPVAEGLSRTWWTWAGLCRNASCARGAVHGWSVVPLDRQHHGEVAIEGSPLAKGLAPHGCVLGRSVPEYRPW